MKKATERRIGPAIYLFGFAGALLFTILLIREGAHDVIRAVATAGWWLAVIPTFHLLPLFLDSFEWWLLFPVESRPGLRTTFWARFLGESFSNLVPAAQVGGDIVRARFPEGPAELALIGSALRIIAGPRGEGDAFWFHYERQRRDDGRADIHAGCRTR